MELLSKKDALSPGLQQYFTGKPCKHGHVSNRYVKTGICVGCVRARKGYNHKVDQPVYGPFISQQQAQDQGLKHFYNGDACKHGHIAAKYASGAGCVECACRRAKGWKAENPSKVKAGNLVYRQTKRDTTKEFHARESNPQRRAVSRLRSLVKNTMIKYGGRKAEKTELLLGCSVEFARRYLESLFLPGMTWDNHGEWHIDHIRPCASFSDLTQLEQQQECCHYTNLQPLWAEDNLSKGATYEPA